MSGKMEAMLMKSKRRKSFNAARDVRTAASRRHTLTSELANAAALAQMAGTFMVLTNDGLVVCWLGRAVPTHA